MYNAISTSNEEENKAVIAYLEALGYSKSPRARNAYSKIDYPVIWVKDDYTWDRAMPHSAVGEYAAPFRDHLPKLRSKPAPPAEVRINEEYVALIHPTHVQVGCQRVEFSVIRELAGKLPS